MCPRDDLVQNRNGGFLHISFAFRIRLLCFPTLKPNRDGERHTHGKSSTNQYDPNFHWHQRHLLLPQIIGQHYPLAAGSLLRTQLQRKGLMRAESLSMTPGR